MARGLTSTQTRAALADGAILIDTTRPGDCSTRWGTAEIEYPDGRTATVAAPAIRAVFEADEVERSGARHFVGDWYQPTYRAKSN